MNLLFTDTLPGDLNRIVEIEQADDGWICPYSRERHLQCINSGSERHVSIFRKDDDAIVGFIILQDIDSPHRALQFRRIVIADKGRGYGRAALRRIKQYCFEELGFHRLWFDVYTDNQRAIQLYESEGFQQEATLRDAQFRQGRFRSLHIYGMLDREYFRER